MIGIPLSDGQRLGLHIAGAIAESNFPEPERSEAQVESLAPRGEFVPTSLATRAEKADLLHNFIGEIERHQDITLGSLPKIAKALGGRV